MDGPTEYYAKWNKSDKDKYHRISHLYVESKKIKQYKQIKQKLVIIRGEKGCGGEQRGWGGNYMVTDGTRLIVVITL